MDISREDMLKICKECSLKVAEWPEWKRNVKLTKYSGLNSEQRKRLNDEEDRERLSKGDYSWWPK